MMKRNQVEKSGQTLSPVNETILYPSQFPQNREGLPDNRAHTCIYGLEVKAPQGREHGRKEKIRIELLLT